MGDRGGDGWICITGSINISEVAQLCPTLCDPMDYSLPGSPVHGIFPGKNTGVGCHFLLQGIFPTQRLNQRLLHWGVVVQSLSRVQFFATPWTATNQSSLFLTITQSLLKFMPTELVMPSNYLISHPLSSPSPPALSLSQHQGLFQ